MQKEKQKEKQKAESCNEFCCYHSDALRLEMESAERRWWAQEAVEEDLAFFQSLARCELLSRPSSPGLSEDH